MHIAYMDDAGDLGALANPPLHNDQPVFALTAVHPRSLCPHDMNVLAVLSGEMDDAFVERCEHQLIVNS